MTSLSRLVVLTLTLTVFAFPALAADDKGRLAADANGDGKVTAVEQTEFAKKRFTAMDVDKDGQITDKDVDARLGEAKARNPKVSDELLQKRNARIKAHFAGMDKDGSKGVSQDEFLARGKDLITAADTDKDGAISATEMKAFRDAKRAAKETAPSVP